MIRVDVLGPLVVTSDGALVDIGGPQPRAVLLTLVHHLGEVVRFDTLIDILWGDNPPRSARNSLQVKVSALRNALGPTFELRTVPTGYVLESGSVETDLAEFDDFCTRARTLLEADPAGAARAAERALSLWRGDPAIGLSDNDSFRTLAGSLHQRYIQARVTLLTAQLQLSQHSECCADAATLADEHPYREDIRALHLLALYRSGRQTEALRAFRTTRELLVEELGIEPGHELQTLHRRILEQDQTLDASPPRSTAAPTTTESQDIRNDNVPVESNQFVDRPEVDQILNSLRAGHATTVLGTGGIGKSRCVTAVARRCRDSGRFPDGVWLVDLAPLPEDTGDIALAVLNAIGLGAEPTTSPLDSIAGYLNSRDALLVLDNCEHVAPAAASFASAILGRAPDTALLAASRVRLEIRSATTIALDSLPDEAALDLLLARVAEVSAGPFPLDACVGLCRVLDNYPLAIELAAARTTTISPTEIVARLAEQPMLLRSRPSRSAATESRHYADLSTALDWSLKQLSDRARATLTRATVFVSDFDLASAEAILTTPDVSAVDVIDDLSELVEHHLVTREHGRARFRILEPIRQHLRDDTAGGPADTYADHFLSFATEAARGLVGPDEAVWWDRFRSELPHVRESIRWAAERGHAERLDPVMEQLAITVSICFFTTPGQWALDAWHTLGRDAERAPGIALAAAAQLAHLDQVDECNQILEQAAPHLDTPRRRATAHCIRIYSDPIDGSWANALFDEAIACGDPALISLAKLRRLDTDMVAFADRHGNPTLRVFARQFASATMPSHQLDKARANRHDIYRIALESNNSHTITGGQMFMALQHCHDLQPAPAGPLIIDMIERIARIGSHHAIWHGVECVANMLAMVGVDPFTAEKLWAAVSTASRPPYSRTYREARLPPMVEAMLTQEELSTAREEGSRLSPDEAARLARKAGETMATS